MSIPVIGTNRTEEKAPIPAALGLRDARQKPSIMLRDHLPSHAMEGQAGREPWSGFVPSPGLRIGQPIAAGGGRQQFSRAPARQADCAAPP
jgi:hypothetical protein